jgi:hypothetical protein
MSARALMSLVVGVAVVAGAAAQADSTARAAAPPSGAGGGRVDSLPEGVDGSAGGGPFDLLDFLPVDGGYNLDDEARGIAVDTEGNVFVTGYFTVPDQGKDIWLARYSVDLVYQDSVTVNGEADGDDEGYAMAFDQDGYLYLIGYMTGPAGNHDIWLGKFDSDLVLQYDITIPGSENDDDDGYGLLFDEVTGNLYAAGTLRETDEGANVWLAIIDTDLVVQDSTTLDGPIDNTDKARFLTFDDSRHLFASGSMTQAVTDYDIWIGKFEADLTFVDQVIVPGPTTDEDKGYGLVFGGSDTLFVTGTMIEPGESYNIWMARVDTDLNLLDDETFNGPVNGEDVAYTMTIDEVGRLHNVGVYTEADGGSNIWLARFDADLALEAWTTVDGPDGGYDTGLGVVNGRNNDLYVSAVVSDPLRGLDIWIGHFAVPTLFADGFESGGTGEWPVACAGAVTVSTAAARTGVYGLEVDVAPPCGPAHDVLLRDMTVSGPMRVASCSAISAGDGFAVAAGGTLALTAHTAVALLDGFRVEPAGSATLSIDSAVPYSAYVQDETPNAETTYNAEFSVYLDSLVLGGGDELDLFVAYDGDGIPQLRLLVREGAGFDAEVRDDAGDPTTIAGGAVRAGWNTIQLGWEASASATVSLIVNGGTPATVSGLDNDAARIEFVRMGAVGGTLTTTSGTVFLDNFISWR